MVTIVRTKRQRGLGTLSRLFAVLGATRPTRSALASAGIILGAVLTGSVTFNTLLTAITAFLVSCMGFVLNDWFDWEIDSRKGRHAIDETGRKDLLVASLCFVGASVFLTPFLDGDIPKLIVFGCIAMLVLYNTRAGASGGLTGNIEVALLASSTLVLGAFSTGRIAWVVVILSVITFFAILAREVAKDIEDIEADRGKRRTLPMRIGKYKSSIVATVSLALSVIIASLYSLCLGVKGIAYAPTIVVLALAVSRLPITQTYIRRFKRLIYLGLVLGIASSVLLRFLS